MTTRLFIPRIPRGQEDAILAAKQVFDSQMREDGGGMTREQKLQAWEGFMRIWHTKLMDLGRLQQIKSKARKS